MTVGAYELHRERRARFAVLVDGELNHPPDRPPETGVAAVEVVGCQIGVELIPLAIELEPTLGDAIREAPHHGADGRVAIDILVRRQVGQRKHDVVDVASLVGNLHLHQVCAEGDDLDRDSLGLQPTPFDLAGLLVGMARTSTPWFSGYGRG